MHFYCGVDTASATITILPTPVSTPISGPDSVCIGASIALADAYPGGTWSVSNSRVSCSAGLLTGNSRGIDTVFYSYANSCGSFTVNQHVTILDIPSTGSITGPMGLCIGTTATFVDSVSGGAWATTDPSVTITDGIAGVSKAGIDTVFYVVSNMCGADTARKVFTADTAVHGTISGKSYVCVGKTDTLTLTPSGGLLIFANADADLFAGTYAQGVSPGKDTITYSFMNYCGTDTSVYTFDVYSDWKCDSINLVPNVTDKKGGQLHIFPNPGSGLYEVSLDQTGNQISVVITDLLGRTVLTAQHSDIDHFDLDIQSEASGAYFITVVVDGVTYNGKLIRW